MIATIVIIALVGCSGKAYVELQKSVVNLKYLEMAIAQGGMSSNIPEITEVITQSDIGARVRVRGIAAAGVLKSFGQHHLRNEPVCGVALDAADGLNDGTLGGHTYFKCPAMHGVLVHPSRVTRFEVTSSYELETE